MRYDIVNHIWLIRSHWLAFSCIQIQLPYDIEHHHHHHHDHHYQHHPHHHHFQIQLPADIQAEVARPPARLFRHGRRSGRSRISFFSKQATTLFSLSGQLKYLTMTDPNKVWMPDTFFQVISIMTWWCIQYSHLQVTSYKWSISWPL